MDTENCPVDEPTRVPEMCPMYESSGVQILPEVQQASACGDGAPFWIYELPPEDVAASVAYGDAHPFAFTPPAGPSGSMSRLTLREYQQQAKSFAVYPDAVRGFYPLLGLVGEIGEAVEKMLHHLFPDGKPQGWDPDSAFIRKMLIVLEQAVVVGQEAERFKKLLRDRPEVVPEGVPAALSHRFAAVDTQQLTDLRKEFGDVLWYIANAAADLGFDLTDIGNENIDKLYSRQQRNALRGSGDAR